MRNSDNLYANNYGKKPAIRRLEPNGEQAYSFEQLQETAQKLQCFFATQNTRTVVSVLTNGYEWDCIDFACYQSAITHVSLHPLTETGLLEKVVTETNPSVIFIGHKFNRSKLEVIVKQLGCTAQIIALYNHAAIQSFYSYLQQFNTQSVGTGISRPDTFLQTIIYTSGSTGIAKGVLLTNKNLLAAQAIFSKAKFFDGCQTALSLLPIALSGERKLNYAYKARGITICYPSAQQTIKESLLYFKPDIVAVVPYLLEKIKSAIEKTEAGTFGFLKAIVCGGASIPISTHHFFQKNNIPLYELYGLTETASVLSFNDVEQNKRGTVGKVPAEMMVSIAPDGEILCKGANMSSGYLNNETQTKGLFDDRGWLCTGDLGAIDKDGFLTITGRKKNLIKTAKGIYVLPELQEQKLQTHPLVEYAFVTATDKNNLQAILLLKPASIGKNEETLLIQWVADCNRQFTENEKIDAVYLLTNKKWKSAGIQALSLKLDRNKLAALITDKESIALYSPQYYD